MQNLKLTDSKIKTFEEASYNVLLDAHINIDLSKKKQDIQAALFKFDEALEQYSIARTLLLSIK